MYYQPDRFSDDERELFAQIAKQTARRKKRQENTRRVFVEHAIYPLVESWIKGMAGMYPDAVVQMVIPEIDSSTTIDNDNPRINILWDFKKLDRAQRRIVRDIGKRECNLVEICTERDDSDRIIGLRISGMDSQLVRLGDNYGLEQELLKAMIAPKRVVAVIAPFGLSIFTGGIQIQK